MTQLLFIINAKGVVHRFTPETDSCPVTRVYTGIKLPVSSNQCLVYKLPHCGECWPSTSFYRQHVEGGTA